MTPSLLWSRARCALQQVEAPWPGSCCAPPGPQPSFSSSARAASPPAGSALSWMGCASPPGPHPPRVQRLHPLPSGPYLVYCASSSRPRRQTGSLAPDHSKGLCLRKERITNNPAQTPCLPLGPPCRAAWARNPRGAGDARSQISSSGQLSSPIVFHQA